MPITTKSNKPGGYVVLRATDTDGFKLNHATLASANSAGETVTEMRKTNWTRYNSINISI